jgi:hypothetical protein
MSKTVKVDPKHLALCAVKADRAENLTREEAQILMNWCDHQSEDLWDGLSLQEILNVYRASAEMVDWEGWASEDWRAAYKAWNSAVIDPGNKMRPRA